MTRARDVANLIGSGNYSSTTFTATAGQTAFSISHTQGFVQVFMNGLLLDETADYTSNGSAVTLTSGAAAGDEIEVVKYNTFSVGDALPKSGGTMSGALTVDAAGATVLTVDRATDDGDIIDLQKNGTSVASIAVNSGDNISIGAKTGGGSGVFMYGAGGSTPYILPMKENALSDNTVTLGDSTRRFKDLYLSGGAYLGGTGASNHLDDYEEGTWTPSFVNGGTFSIHNAKYTKIGKLCYVGAYIHTIANIPNNSNLAEITGFPFANSNDANHYHGVGAISYVSSANWSQYDILPPTPRKGSNSMYFHHGGGSAAGLNNSNFRVLNGHQLIFALVYQTD